MDDGNEKDWYLLIIISSPTWSLVRCRRYNSPPASSLMDFICFRSDGSHVSVDTVHPSLLRSSPLSSPRWYHLFFLPTYSWSRLLTCPNHLSIAFLHLSVMVSTLSLSLILSFLIWSLSVWPHAHLHFCHFQFIHVEASHWYCIHPVQHCWLNDRLLDISFMRGGTLLSHRTPAIFLQLLHPHCVISFISVFWLQSLCRVLPVYLNSVTCGSWSDRILTLPNGVPFRHKVMYSVFALDTFNSLFSNASPHCSSSNSGTYFSLAHSTTSSTNIICQGASFMMFSVSESIMWQTGKVWKRIIGGGYLPLQRVRTFLQHTSLQFRIDGTWPSQIWCTLLQFMMSPLFSMVGIKMLFRHVSGMYSSSVILFNASFRKFTPVLLKLFQTSIGKLSVPVAFPFFMFLIAILISAIVISVMSTSTSACRSFLPSLGLSSFISFW